jgi:hypothetical protein
MQLKRTAALRHGPLAGTVIFHSMPENQRNGLDAPGDKVFSFD